MVDIPTRLVIATQNAHKVIEIEDLLKSRGIACVSLEGHKIHWDETGSTFRDNARIKAYAVRSLMNEPVLADDSGLCVDALSGRPGVYSARFAGEGATDAANNQKLLLELGDTVERRAKFVCHLTYIDREGELFEFTGEAHGHIARTDRGLKGFGYDPLFIPDGFDQSFAELPLSVKQQISHRGRAMQLFLDHFGH